MKRPAFQFYPADWRKDMALQSCSVAARGLWVDMLCIAHECEPYGHLTVNGKAMTPAQIGRHTGLTERECAKLLGELADSGVSSVTDEGVIFSRRMVRDEEIRNKRAEGGKAGSEHGAKGAEHGIKGGRPKKERGVSEPPIEPPPSSSSSTSVKEYTQSSTVVETHGVPTIAECPHSEILKLWAEILPSARQPADWNAQRQALLRARWREKPARQSVDWWRRLFEYVSRSDFLMGRTASRDRAPFLLSLDWLLKPANFLKVLEGAYESADAAHA